MTVQPTYWDDRLTKHTCWPKPSSYVEVVLELAWICFSWVSFCVFDAWIFLTSLRMFSKANHIASNKTHSLPCLAQLSVVVFCFFFYEIWIKVNLVWNFVSSSSCAFSKCEQTHGNTKLLILILTLWARNNSGETNGTSFMCTCVEIKINNSWAYFFFFYHLANNSFDLIWSELAQVHWCWKSFCTNSHQLRMLTEPVCASVVLLCFFLPYLLLFSFFLSLLLLSILCLWARLFLFCLSWADFSAGPLTVPKV